MGKAKKIKVARSNVGKGQSLADQVLSEAIVKESGRVKVRKRDEEDAEYVDEKLSRKILDQARQQQAELEEEHGTARPTKRHGGHGPATGSFTSLKKVNLGQGSSKQSSDTEEDDDELEEEAGFYEHIHVAEEDERALAQFMSHNPPARRTLADIIQEKITEKQTEIQSHMTDNASVQMEQLDERIVKMYKSIRQILQKYRSGKLPKAFKIIPSLQNWEQVLYLTDPDSWSAAAMYQATRIFASNLNAKMAQRFFNLVLMPRVRDDITEYKRLNFHLYMALKKSLFKPSAFFKGILLPICEAGDCTLREAVIIASILTKNSIPMLHSAATLLKIAEMDYTGANSIFLRALLDKKYALPYRVIDAVVFHFLGFTRDKRELPVLWHQSLLTFVQRYKEDMSSEQKEALLGLLRAHVHEQITPEVRRELVNSKCRDVEVGDRMGLQEKFGSTEMDV